MKLFFAAALISLALAGCAAEQTSPAQQADAAACTAQGDAQYQQDTVDQSARTAQNGLRFGATPTHVFDAETMGALSQRDNQVQNCEALGSDNGQPVINGAPLAAPHFVN